jgi:hypothetical protein
VQKEAFVEVNGKRNGRNKPGEVRSTICEATQSLGLFSRAAVGRERERERNSRRNKEGLKGNNVMQGGPLGPLPRMETEGVYRRVVDSVSRKRKARYSARGRWTL